MAVAAQSSALQPCLISLLEAFLLLGGILSDRLSAEQTEVMRPIKLGLQSSQLANCSAACRVRQLLPPC